MKVDYYRYIKGRGDTVVFSEQIDDSIPEVRKHIMETIGRMDAQSAVHAVISSLKGGSEVSEGMMSRVYGDLLWLDRHGSYHSQYADGSIGPVRKNIWRSD